MPSYRRLQQCAIGISGISVVYNAAEGAVSIVFGSESSSRSLVFFGIQSAIEVISALLVLWRFRKVAKPGEENLTVLSEENLRVEKIASGSIGGLLLALGLGTEVTAIVALALHQHPDTSNASLIISASALIIMILIWLPKRHLAKALNSSAMQGEATCSLSCIQITIVLFLGSLIYRFWHGGWWVDSATSILLGLLFGREGWKMVKWVRNPAFDGGCCEHCVETVPVELGEQYRDLCSCCLEKPACLEAGSCVCESNKPHCCEPKSSTGSKCCTHAIVTGPRPPPQTVPIESPHDASPDVGGTCGGSGCCETPAPDKPSPDCGASGCCETQEATVEPISNTQPTCCSATSESRCCA